MKTFRIISNEEINGPVFRLVLEPPNESLRPMPGQFYSIRCGQGFFPLLRRPFSLHREMKSGVENGIGILYRVLGRGTEWLSKRTPNEWLDIIGPLGNGFRLDWLKERMVLVGRGIGIAPLYAVAQRFLLDRPKGCVAILIGARTSDRLFYISELKRLGEVFVYTDDGSQGFRGRAPDLLLHLLECGTLSVDDSFFACGPGSMLRDLFGLSLKWPFKAQVALEEHMGCGFGVCLSCAVPLKTDAVVRDTWWPKPACMTAEGGERTLSLVCKDGPVYDMKEVDWDLWLS